jgi:DNA-binding NarL/FixJ family response regulator
LAETILIVDDDSSLRALVACALDQAGFDTVEAAASEHALDLARRHELALVVLDVNIPGVSGYEICRRLRDEFGPALPILFLSGERTESFDKVAGLLVGGDDYLVKPFSPDELVARVQKLAGRAQGQPEPAAARLTKRESEVLSLLAEGKSQAQIARTLVISPKTVGTHIEHILSKLGVRSRAQAVAYAYREGLVKTAV